MDKFKWKSATSNVDDYNSKCLEYNNSKCLDYNNSKYSHDEDQTKSIIEEIYQSKCAELIITDEEIKTVQYVDHFVKKSVERLIINVKQNKILINVFPKSMKLRVTEFSLTIKPIASNEEVEIIANLLSNINTERLRKIELTNLSISGGNSYIDINAIPIFKLLTKMEHLEQLIISHSDYHLISFCIVYGMRDYFITSRMKDNNFPFHKLEKLNFSSNTCLGAIDDGRLLEFFITNCTNLKWLDLSSNNLYEIPLDKFLSIFSIPFLRDSGLMYLNISDNDWYKEEIKILRDHFSLLPNLELLI